MANTTANTTIKNSWSLIAFAKTYGSPKLAELTNHETGEVFKSLAFVQGEDVTFVRFSSKLGELTPAEVVKQKDDLQVVQLESGNYTLCKKGDPSKAWQDIDLF